MTFNVSRETQDKLDNYVTLLLKWQKSVNLISPTTIEDVWTRHIEDSLQLFNLIPTTAENVFDLGSGGGLPGIILAIMGVKKITLVESDRKKSLFLKTAIRELSLKNAHVINDRVENIPHNIADCITARAFAPLNKIISLSQPIATNTAVGIFPKGRDYQHEINDLNDPNITILEIIPSITDKDARILKISF